MLRSHEQITSAKISPTKNYPDKDIFGGRFSGKKFS
jgi:hypothetical protein